MKTAEDIEADAIREARESVQRAGLPAALGNELASKVITEARKLVEAVHAGEITAENLREMVEATGDGEPAMALQFLVAESVHV